MNRPTLVGLSPISPNGPAATAYLSTSMTFEQFRYVGTLQKFFLVLVWGPHFCGGPCSAEHAEHAFCLNPHLLIPSVSATIHFVTDRWTNRWTYSDGQTDDSIMPIKRADHTACSTAAVRSSA